MELEDDILEQSFMVYSYILLNILWAKYITFTTTELLKYNFYLI